MYVQMRIARAMVALIKSMTYDASCDYSGDYETVTDKAAMLDELFASDCLRAKITTNAGTKGTILFIPENGTDAFSDCSVSLTDFWDRVQAMARLN